MGKRKRYQSSDQGSINGHEAQETKEPLTSDHASIIAPVGKVANSHDDAQSSGPVLQIIVGTYDRILHGLIAVVTSNKSALEESTVEFADTFLFNAHASAIRCLALSPIKDSSDKILLASGGSDQLVNLYSLDARYVRSQNDASTTSPVERRIIENTKNRELGSLQHHEGGVNVLYFPTKSKLLTAADDNTMAVARTKDWTILSSIKVPNPKVPGYASGDAALPGPSGVNDLAIHPSLKLMISVGKREKCMRLWNLMTGKKAAVLSFDRAHLQSAGEGKHSQGEGQKVRWNGHGEEFTIAFDRGCLVYGIDCKPRLTICPVPRTKIHQLRYVALPSEPDESREVLVLSTDDGRVLFYSTKIDESELDSDGQVHNRKPFAQLRSSGDGTQGRFKDFQIVTNSRMDAMSIITVNSEGSVRLWLVSVDELIALVISSSTEEATSNGNQNKTERSLVPELIGSHIGTCETGQRITCLEAFQMLA